jgi:transcriptional regulator with XRE-family HTH domain
MQIHYIDVRMIDTPRTAQEMRLARIRHRMTQEQLAKAVNISRSFIAQVESGQKEINVSFAERIKDYFDSLDFPPSQPDTGGDLSS